MANWAFIENNQIIETHDSLPKNWRNVSNLDVVEHDEFYLKKIGWYKIYPKVDKYDHMSQITKSIGFSFDGDKVFEKYEIINLNVDDLYNDFISKLRETRNNLLKESDYLVAYDLIISRGQEYLITVSHYRQELRDLPEKYPNTGKIYDINNVIYPIKVNIKDFPKTN